MTLPEDRTPPLIRKGNLGAISFHLEQINNPGRGYVIGGTSVDGTIFGQLPSAGGHVDGVSSAAPDGTVTHGIAAVRGVPLQVEAGGSVSLDDELQVDSNGRFVTASGGRVVARALQSANVGDFFEIVFV